MEMGRIVSELLNESILRCVMPNGLQVVIMPRRGQQQTYLAYTVRYGAAHRHEEGVPDGIQHFLEHMTFARPEGQSIFLEFQERGAAVSGYTTSYLTSYYVSCVEQVERNLDALLELVQRPQITADLVEAERKVIEQEIRLFEADAESQVQVALLRGLYGADHPLGHDLLGTVDSIARITPELLQACHDRFYHPANAILTVIGDVDAQALCDRLEKEPPAAPRAEVSFVRGERAGCSRIEQEGDVHLPLCMIGFRTERTDLRSEQAVLLGMQALFGDDFYCHVEYAPDFGHVLLGEMTPDPDAFVERVRTALAGGLSAEAFEQARVRQWTLFLADFDDLYQLGTRLCAHLVRGFDDLQAAEHLRTVTREEAERQLHALLEEGICTVSVVYPRR